MKSLKWHNVGEIRDETFLNIPEAKKTLGR